MTAFIKFNKGLMYLPIRWQNWLLLLVTANLIVPLFYLHRLEAQVVIGTLMASMAFMTILTDLTGFTRLLGLGHIFWLPLLYFLWSRLGHIPTSDFFGIWIRAVIILNSISLIIDVSDVMRYIAGDRIETVQGLS